MAPAKKEAATGLEVAAPLVLVGEPGFVQGRLCLRNPGADKKTLRDLRLTERRAKPKKGQPADPEPALAIDLPRVTVRPNASKEVALNLALNRNAAPGTYALDLALEGKTHPVELVVTEVVDLEIQPSEIFLEGKPGAKFEKLLFFQNHGNVPVNVPAVGAVQLDIDMLHCRAPRAALKALGEADCTLDEIAAAFAKSYKAELASFAPLRVTNDALTIDPGASVSAKFTFQIPSKTPKRVPATASIQIVSETVTIRVLAV
ncbi:hypothetical protein [Ruegeria sp. HKCCD8929]|uniref:COG1470 family protein n=1 Tax=Ruegeria sp. HKCCD8929 TaxID=2683006 RepID=UPI001488C594|nr:hypothetical protein [Ruegeria sp. HKCCD8929]